MLDSNLFKTCLMISAMIFCLSVSGVSAQPCDGPDCPKSLSTIPKTVQYPEGRFLEWDWVNSAETIVRDSSVGVYVLGGVGPFQWEVVGTDFSLDNAEPQSRGNTLSAGPNSCGSAIITVTDARGDVTEGSVRNTSSGYWHEYPGECGLQAAPDSWNIRAIGSILENQWPVNATVVRGYQKQYHMETLAVNSRAQGSSPTQGECEAQRLTDCGTWTTPCLPYPGSWNLFTDKNVRWQGVYEECDGEETHRECRESGGTWSYIRALHNDRHAMLLRYWEWECQ